MFMDKILIIELPLENTFPSSAILVGDISSLYHKPWYDPMELVSFIVKRLTIFPIPLPRTQTFEVPGRFGNIRKQLKNHLPYRLLRNIIVNRDVHENNVIPQRWL